MKIFFKYILFSGLRILFKYILFSGLHIFLARTIHPRLGQLIETERLLEEVKQATMRTDETDKKYALVQEELSLIKQQLAMMLEKQGGGSSTSTSRVHLHYDEDLDDHPVP